MGRVAILAIAVLLCWPICASAAELAGRASIIDGDTIEIHGQHIRLFGIDALESRQLCEAGGYEYRCGQLAALALADEIGQRTVACEPRDTDRYGRVVAVCRAGGEDLGAWLVSEGWALAYRHYSGDYIDEEDDGAVDQMQIVARSGGQRLEHPAPDAVRRPAIERL